MFLKPPWGNISEKKVQQKLFLLRGHFKTRQVEATGAPGTTGACAARRATRAGSGASGCARGQERRVTPARAPGRRFDPATRRSAPVSGSPFALGRHVSQLRCPPSIFTASLPPPHLPPSTCEKIRLVLSNIVFIASVRSLRHRLNERNLPQDISCAKTDFLLFRFRHKWIK